MHQGIVRRKKTGIGNGASVSSGVQKRGGNVIRPFAEFPLSANLQNSIGLAPTFTRSTTATFTDYEGIIRMAGVNEARFEGGRRVENLCLQSENFTATTWIDTVSGTSTKLNSDVMEGSISGLITSTSLGGGIRQVIPVKSSSTYLLSLIVIPVDCFSITFRHENAVAYGSYITAYNVSFPSLTITKLYGTTGDRLVVVPYSPIPGAYKVYVNFGLSGSTSGRRLQLEIQTADGNVGTSFRIIRPQVEDITGSSYLQPSEYVPTAGAPASKWFTTRPDGSPIYPTPKLLMERQSTNYFLNSGTPANHTSPTCPAGTYTLWLTGTGSIAVAAGTAVGSGWGTATEATPLTVTITTAGTVTFTVTGTVTIAQFEPLPVKSSYIPTTTSAVTRSADALSWPLSDQLQAMLNIDKAWTTSLADETTAGTNQCDMTDATALFKWSTLDAAPFANSGKMVIMRDASNRLAWGFLGAVSGTTGCLVYKDQARTIPGYVKEAGLGAVTTFDVVADCKVEGTVVLDWVPGFTINTVTTYPRMISFGGGTSIHVNHVQVIRTSDYSTEASRIDYSATGFNPAHTYKLIVRWSSVSQTKKLTIIETGNTVRNGSVDIFDGNFIANYNNNLAVSTNGMLPCKYSNLKFFKRWLSDSELMRLQ